MTDELNRRQFLEKTLSVTAAVPFLALVGCDKGGGGAEKPAAGGEAPAAGGEAPAAGGGAAEAAPTCDLAQVPDAQKATRTALGYVEKSPNAEKNCANCNLYKADNGAGCPGCTLFPGPVAAEGYCNSWVAKA